MKRPVVFLLVLIMSMSLLVPAVALGADSSFKSNLVLYSSMTDNDLNNLVRLFGEKYPNITVEIVNGSAGELTSRINAEKNRPQGVLCGVASATATDTCTLICLSTGCPIMKMTSFLTSLLTVSITSVTCRPSYSASIPSSRQNWG